MKISTLIDISIIIFLITTAIFINYSLTNFANDIDSVNMSDKIFEYNMLFIIYFGVISFIFRFGLYLLFINPIEKINQYIDNLKHKDKTNLSKKNLFCITQEVKDLVSRIEYLGKEIQELSMEFELNVKRHTQELASINKQLNDEKEFVHKIIERLSDIVFVVKNNILVKANDNFYKRFNNLETFLKSSDHNTFEEYLKKCKSHKGYLKVDSRLFSTKIELLSGNYYINTLIDMTDYYESIKLAQDQNPLTKLPGNETIKNICIYC